jgi:hypothetical protein
VDSTQGTPKSNGRGERDNPSGRITLADVNRVLDAGQLLVTVLTPEELSDLRALLETNAFTSHLEPNSDPEDYWHA